MMNDRPSNDLDRIRYSIKASEITIPKQPPSPDQACLDDTGLKLISVLGLPQIQDHAKHFRGAIPPLEGDDDKGYCLQHHPQPTMFKEKGRIITTKESPHG
jgi:hypothetical protein